MHKIWLVIKREYLTRVRTKAFIVSTVGLPLFTVGIFAVALALATSKTDHTLRISIVDNLGGVAPQIAAGLKDKLLPDGRPIYQVVRTWDRPPSDPSLELGRQVRAGQLDGYVLIPRDILESNAAVFHTRNPDDYQTTRAIGRAITFAVVERRLNEQGIHVDNLARVMRSADLSLVKVSERGESEEKGEGLMVRLSIVMILYITLLAYGVMTMRSVLEEKTTRIVEILVSSVKPSHLLTGKILGIAAVGLTQYLIWALTVALVSGYGAAVGSAFMPGASAPSFHVPAAFLAYSLVFFLAGYFLYASVYAALGAMVSNDDELQQVQMPVTLLLIVCFILYPVISRNPNSPLAVILTMIPFFAPILMVFRITVQTPPFWQIALSLAICAATTCVIVQISARIYRVGILMYGKRPSLVELIRWLRYT
jgi:ABC-2 type transport system permease protein